MLIQLDAVIYQSDRVTQSIIDCCWLFMAGRTARFHSIHFNWFSSSGGALSSRQSLAGAAAEC